MPTAPFVGARIRTLDPRGRTRPRSPGATAGSSRSATTRRCASTSGRARDVIDGAGLAVVPGLVDSHIHPFYGTLQTRGVDLRSARTLDEVRARLADERAALRAGHSGCSATACATSRSTTPASAPTRSPRRCGDSPAFIGFFDGHTALARRGAGAAPVSTARASSTSPPRSCRPGRPPTGALLENARDGPRPRGASRAGRRPSGSTRSPPRSAAQRGRAHRRARDARRPGAARRVPRARGAGRPDRCGC